MSLEEIGITDDVNNIQDSENPVLKSLNEPIKFVNDRYSVEWPWKETEREMVLPENYELAAGRLRSLVSRLSKMPKVMTKYDETIRHQLSTGVIEPVDTTNDTDSLKHYIPHHCVVKPDSTTTKIRITYDASAKTKSSNNSLNNCLEGGPTLLPDLCGILVRFRLNPIAIISDVEKAFLQVDARS